jgi:uncharacterized protein (DUF58 family)
MSPARRAAARRPSQARLGLVSVRRALGSGARNLWASIVALGRRLLAWTAPVTEIVSPAGWLVLAAAAMTILLASVFGWVEFTFLGVTLLAAVVIAVAFVFGRAQYRVSVELEPHRVVAGERAHGRMVVRNIATSASTPTRMELPVGGGVAEFMIPTLAPRDERDELFAVPTHRRAVIVAGPAITVRGDQLGLLRRTVRWTDEVELFVHPVTTRLAPSAAGLVRDLEGEVTKTITNDDISFHALRAYEPGDAMRNVHWRTSARTGQLMVRQFEETRRSQLTIVHTTERASYADDDEFELGVSVMASLAVQVILDATRLSVVTESRQLRTATPTALLDDTSRIEPVAGEFTSVRDFARHATRRLPAPSVAMIVAGSALPLSEFRTVETLFGIDTQTFAFRVEAGGTSSIATVSGMRVVTVGQLSDLPRLLTRLSG